MRVNKSQPKDFQNAIEKVSGKSYQWFFDQWIYKIGMPNLVVTKKYDNAKKQLLLTVKQNQGPENKSGYEQANFFKGKIAIEIDGRRAYMELKPQAETIP
jgi:aminopeptidase N